MTEKKKPTEAELQEWLDGVHFSSCCSDPLVSSKNKHKTEQAAKDSPKNSYSESTVKNEG